MTTFKPYRQAAVPERKPGETAATAIKPAHTPSLLETLGINPFRDSAKEWQRFCYLAVRDSQAHRIGIKNGTTNANGK